MIITAGEHSPYEEGDTQWEYVIVQEAKDAWTETVSAGFLPMGWIRFIQSMIVAQTAAPVISKVV